MMNKMTDINNRNETCIDCKKIKHIDFFNVGNGMYSLRCNLCRKERGF